VLLDIHLLAGRERGLVGGRPSMLQPERCTVYPELSWIIFRRLIEDSHGGRLIFQSSIELC
jgi:hypothetical protein